MQVKSNMFLKYTLTNLFYHFSFCQNFLKLINLTFAYNAHFGVANFHFLHSVAVCLKTVQENVRLCIVVQNMLVKR